MNHSPLELLKFKKPPTNNPNNTKNTNMDSFISISPKDIKENPIKLFGDDWALVAAGTKDDFNELTVS